MNFLKEDIRVNFGKISLKEILFNDKLKLLFFYRLTNHYYYKINKNPIERLLQSIFNKFFQYYSRKFCIDFKAKVKIGYGLHIPHPIGIVINGKSTIGNNCTIMQQVTLGNNLLEINKAPIIGDNVKIGAGAKIIGNVKIGDNVIIGANAVVTKDIPENCVVGGVPAKIIRKINETIN
jgi:serine O-acetyltransferase